MSSRTRFTSTPQFTEARRELAGQMRDLADRLDSQAVHDAWEVLVELGEEAGSLRAHFQSASRAGGLAG